MLQMYENRSIVAISLWLLWATAGVSDLAVSPGWEAQSGSARASIVKLNGRDVLKLPCNFSRTQIKRGCWDKRLALDLTSARALQFKFYCPDRSSVSHFMLYLHSGQGWYVAAFDEKQAGAWNTITIEKSAMEAEGRPGGWAGVDKIRMTAWRGGDRDAVFYLSDLHVLGGDASVVVIRGDSASRGEPAQSKAIVRYAQTVAGALDALGISYGFLSDHDVTAERLKKRKVVILAYSPALPAAVVRELAVFLRAGGKLICFYVLPGELVPLVGIKPGPHLRPQYPGQFSSVRPILKNPLKIPAVTGQNSWNIQIAQPVANKSVTAAYWHDSSGKSTGQPAIIVSDNCVLMTHVFIDDDPINKRNLLLGMVGRFQPESWQRAADASLDEIGRFGPYTDGTAALRALAVKTKGNRSATGLVKQAESLRERAGDLVRRKQFAEARGVAGDAQRKLIEAYCSVQPSRAGEFRAFWCHSAFGVDGMSWDAAVKTLADNGFDAVIPNMSWGGLAFYPSKVLPVAPEVRKRGDQVAACALACKTYGVACHVWKVCWNMASNSDAGFVARMKREGRVQVSRGGVVKEKWLCPSHPKNRQLEIDAMLELVRTYDIAGIHFDYIRYPGTSHCFCAGCRKRFELLLGSRVKEWPDGVGKGGRHEARWLDFRRQNITAVVRTVSRDARKIKPGIQISAAVFPNYPADRDSVGQDWKLWCEKGYLDFVCPMNYMPSTSAFEQIVGRQLRWAGSVPLYPGIGLSTWSRAGDVCRLIDQVKVARRLGAKGFTVFEYGASEARDVVPLCGLGLTNQ